MKSLGLLLGSLLLLGGISRAQTGGSVTGTSPVSLDVAAAKSFDYLIAHCTCQPPRVDFWKNPQDAGVGSDQNGWQGAQSMQSAVINYECTHDDKYLKVIQDFANWTTQRYSGKNNLTLCQTWPAYDFEKEKGVGQSLPHFCMWDDDAGWVMNMYLQFYQYTKQSGFLDDAYQTLLNGDKQWGVDFQRNSRGLHYKDHEDHFPIYMAAQLVGALGISDALRRAGDRTRADRAFTLACQYDNFIENYLHSTGRGHLNITGNRFGMAADCYEIATSFGYGAKDPPPTAKCKKLTSAFFTTPHMLMAAAYVMLDEAQHHGADVSQVNPEFRNFHERARLAADAFTTPYPNGYLENAASGSGTVFIDACDPNVNGFACLWWSKYVVPLDPPRYGSVVIRTAREIMADQGTGDLSDSMWNTPRDDLKEHASHSIYADAAGWVMVRDASACSILAAANWIEKTYHLER